MVILGIDPGYAIIGYGAVETRSGKYITKGYGAIYTKAEDDFSDRLETIYDSLTEVLKIYNPDVVSIEKLYFQNNQKTAIGVAEARGVITLAVKKFGAKIYEYTPLQVKTAVTGYGKAQKKQVMAMTQRLLRLDEIPKPDDTADALAIAICYANSVGIRYKETIIERRKAINDL